MQTHLQQLLVRLQAGDEAAAAEVVALYESEMRRAIRVRLTDPRLRRVVDSADICQSVFANFFTRAQFGEFDLEQSGDLTALLLTMARNKLLDQFRRMRAGKRDQRRDATDSALLGQVAESGDGPAELVARRDLLHVVRQRLSPDEQRIADLRMTGLDWSAVARECGSTAEAVRKQFTRALDRVAEELGLEELR